MEDRPEEIVDQQAAALGEHPQQEGAQDEGGAEEMRAGSGDPSDTPGGGSQDGGPLPGTRSEGDLGGTAAAAAEGTAAETGDVTGNRGDNTGSA